MIGVVQFSHFEGSNVAGFICVTCGAYHPQIPMCFGPSAPEMWLSMSASERKNRAELSSDQCVIDGKHFFLLGRIVLPVLGSPEPFIWLAWVSLSEVNFYRASELWNQAGRENEPPYFAWLQSALPYDVSTINLKTRVLTQPIGERPLIELEPTDHPLSLEQHQGITMTRVQQIAEAILHRSQALFAVSRQP